jgi:hydrogenase/urease accessory protein HupE
MIVNHAQHEQFKRELATLSCPRRKPLHLAKVPFKEPVIVLVVVGFARGKKLAKRFWFSLTRFIAEFVANLFECFAHGRKMAQPLILVHGVLY